MHTVLVGGQPLVRIGGKTVELPRVKLQPLQASRVIAAEGIGAADDRIKGENPFLIDLRAGVAAVGTSAGRTGCLHATIKERDVLRRRGRQLLIELRGQKEFQRKVRRSAEYEYDEEDEAHDAGDQLRRQTASAEMTHPATRVHLFTGRGQLGQTRQVHRPRTVDWSDRIAAQELDAAHERVRMISCEEP
ncbi:hypothetical protein [uncultured Jatrophihabitans sp.]|uniref:hypothetical protein n=1 Tax=uncultured Jatrophihabitans sp. TaxID=1610747 RepID=UPI0035CCA6FB